MNHDRWGNLLFLSSLTAFAAGCASGTSSEPQPGGPFVTTNDSSDPGDPWAEPIDTSGASDESGPMDDGGGWPNEGESGTPGETGASGEEGGDDETGAPVGDTGDVGDEDGGDTGEWPDDSGDGSTTGAATPDPCPALAQLYADCNPDYIYEYEIELCNQATEQAQSISQACAAAHADYLACLSTVDCAALLSPDVPFGCILQSAAAELAC